VVSSDYKHHSFTVDGIFSTLKTRKTAALEDLALHKVQQLIQKTSFQHALSVKKELLLTIFKQHCHQETILMVSHVAQTSAFADKMKPNLLMLI
jgi:hypothetical protein